MYTQGRGTSILNPGLFLFLPGRNELSSLVHSSMAISCLALNENAPLREADIEQNFMIDFVFVTDRWEIYVPTSIGNIPLRIAGEGLKIRASFQNDELKRADNEEMDPNLGPAISQAIRDDPRIGRVWVAQ